MKKKRGKKYLKSEKNFDAKNLDLLRSNMIEDEEIHRLEVLLNMKSKSKKSRIRNNLPVAFCDDGLDYILDTLNPTVGDITPQQTPTHTENTIVRDPVTQCGDPVTQCIDPVTQCGDFVTQYAITPSVGKKRRRTKLARGTHSIAGHTVSEAEFHQAENVIRTDRQSGQSSGSEEFISVDDIERHRDVTSADQGLPAVSSSAAATVQQEEQEPGGRHSGEWEDIYGRRRASDGRVIPTQRYVPPALRSQMIHDSANSSQHSRGDGREEVGSQLRRRIQGQLNRISASNLASIAALLSKLYLSHSRYDVTSALCDCVIGSCAPISIERVQSSRLIGHMCLLVTILHTDVATDVGAHFVQDVVSKMYSQLMNENTAASDKSLDNYIIILSYLYLFQIIGCNLINEILAILVTRFDEKHIQLVLILFAHVGPAMRKRDPTNLRHQLNQIQVRVSSCLSDCEATSLKARVRFLLQSLTALRNNNSAKWSQLLSGACYCACPDPAEFVRLLRTVTPREVAGFDVTLSDILHVETRGKWWLVGSAPTSSIHQSPVTLGHLSKNSDCRSFTDLKQLAIKHRMNSEFKRNVFCLLVNAEDYVECCQSLLQLLSRAKHKMRYQQIIIVVLECCLKERSYNPYYVYVLSRLCSSHRKFKYSTAVCIESKLRDGCESMADFASRNLASIIIHLLTHSIISLTVFKSSMVCVNLSLARINFHRQLFKRLILETSSEHQLLSIFSHLDVAVSQQLANFLGFFLKQYVLQDCVKFVDGDQLANFRCRCGAIVSLLTCNHVQEF